MDTAVYEFRTFSISFSKIYDSPILILISSDVFYDFSNVSMSSTLSKIVSSFASASNFNIFFSPYIISFLKFAKFFTFSSLFSSISLRSFFTTSPNN